MTSLNPVMKIGKQITESIHTHLDVTRDVRRRARGVAARRRCACPIPSGAWTSTRTSSRAACANGCASRSRWPRGPQLLFADEPTTALDVTVQAQVLDLLEAQQRERFMAMVLVTHDLGVVAGRTDDVVVMYAGQVVEKASTADALRRHADALHRGAAALDPEDRRAEPHPARRDPGAPARPRSTSRRAAGSPARCAYVQDRCREEQPPLLDGAHARARVPLLVPGRHARGAQARSSATEPRVLERDGRGGDLMAGTGTAHLRAEADVAAARRGPRRRVPGGARRCKVNAVSGISLDLARGRDARAGRRVRAAGSRRPGGRSCSSRRPPSGRVQLRRRRAHRAARATTCARCARGCR